jgi:hypothetical protein
MGPTDVDIWVLLIILLLILILLLLFLSWWFPRQRERTPVVVLDATGRNAISDMCGDPYEIVYINYGPGGMVVNVEVTNVGNCEATLSVRTVPPPPPPNQPPAQPADVLGGFLVVGGMPNRRAARLPLGVRESVSYMCAHSGDEEHRCKLEIKITSI